MGWELIGEVWRYWLQLGTEARVADDYVVDCSAGGNTCLQSAYYNTEYS